jgi:hypothetical protein
MDVSVKQNRQMRSMTIALGAAILAAVVAMFIPISALESITGATGLSELVPATAAPLGDTARALIAFAAGALTLALMTVLLLHKDAVAAKPVTADAIAAGIPENDDDLATTWRERIAKIGLPSVKLPNMPWVKGEDDVTELADLPKLRNGDIHPDAPARRPLSATQDLPVLDLTETAEEPYSEESVAAVEAAFVPTEIIAKPLVPVAAAVVFDAQPTLDEMVAQLEASVMQRQQQLAELEIVAARLASGKPDHTIEVAEPVDAQHIDEPAEIELSAEPVRAERPPLEAVPDSPAKQDDMDDALAAALATLHRMNGTQR